MTRKLNVQTPGAAPTTNTEPQEPTVQEQTPGAAPEGADGEADTVDVAALHARIAALEADNGRLAAENAEKQAAADPEANRKAAADADEAFERASASITRTDRAKYLTMRADQVDPKKLAAAVLTRDGWVAPDQTGQKAKGG